MNTPRNCEACERARRFLIDCAVAVAITVVSLGAATLLSGCGHYRVSGAFEYSSNDAPTSLPAPRASGVGR